MDEEVDVVVLKFDVPAPKAAEALARAFGLELTEAKAFVAGVPRAAKHGTSPALAERYARALRDIGAVVELRPVKPTSGRPSLPDPSEPQTDVMTIAGPSAETVDRFRSARGVSPSMDPRAEAAAYEERVPRAPPVPHDIERMPNAILPRWSERPLDEKPLYSAAPPRNHSNADMPPAIKFAEREDDAVARVLAAASAPDREPAPTPAPVRRAPAPEPPPSPRASSQGSWIWPVIAVVVVVGTVAFWLGLR